MIGLYSALIGVLMDWLGRWVVSDFRRILFEVTEFIFDVLIALIISYLCCSLLFTCPAPTLPCYLFC